MTKNETEVASTNPHDATLGPHDAIPDAKIATVVEALYGASTLVRLLRNDSLLRAFQADADDPNDEEPSFRDGTVEGLQIALAMCLERAQWAIDHVGDPGLRY